MLKKYNIVNRRLAEVDESTAQVFVYTNPTVEEQCFLVESYQKFDGKVISAEHIAPEVIKVTYEDGGKTRMLVFDGVTGDYIVQ